MPDITISTNDKPAEQEQTKSNDIVDTLQKADNYAKLKEQNDKMEAEISRREDLKARMSLGGRSLAGQTQEQTEEEKAKSEAAELVKQFR